MRTSPVRRRFASILAVALVVLMSGCVGSADKSVPTPDINTADRVFQAVAITMAPDGTATGVKATNVYSLPAVGTAAATTATTTASFGAQQVVNDLPARVLTSWQADGKRGTDLRDLSGHSGPVEIDVTVENLTGAPRQVTYDVAGSSQTTTAMVFVPLTVVASAQLAGVSPGQIVVPSPTSADQAVTNGVVSPASTSGATVQWAAILAPPQLPAATTFRLVLNADDLQVPTVDLTVMPGVSTDMSAASVASSAVAGDDSSDVDMLSRTVQLIADVNAVLSQASTTISQVADNLDATGQTLGAQAISDLSASTTAVAQDMSALVQQADDLGSALSSSLQTTRSSLAATLQQTVDAATQALGDTSQPPASATIAGAACSAVVSPIGSASSLYGTLQEVVAQLGAYGQVDQECKEQIQQSLVALVGPSDPDQATCQGSTSLGCAVLAAQASFDGIADSLNQAAQQAVGALDPDLAGDVHLDFQTLSGNIDAVGAAAQQLGAATTVVDQTDALDALREAMSAVSHDSSALSAAILALHADAQGALQNNADMTTTAQNLQTQVCGLIGDGTLTAEQGDGLLSYIAATSSTGLPGCAPAGTAPGPPGSGAPAGGYAVTPNAASSLSADLGTQQGQIQAIVDATGGSGADPTTASMLVPLNTDIATVVGLLSPDSDLVTQNQQNVATGEAWSADLEALGTAVAAMQATRDTLTPQMSALAGQQATLTTTVSGAMTTAAQQIQTQAQQATSAELGALGSGLRQGLGMLETMFAQSTSSLAGAAASIQASGAAVVGSQEAAIRSAADRAGVTIDSQAAANLAQITSSVNASTQNLDAASALLSSDLRAVLLDLGASSARTGLLGSIATSSATANAANSQLATATQTATSYANARSQDMAGIQLQAAQTRAALQAQADLPLFHLDLPATVVHQTVYSFHIGADQ